MKESLLVNAKGIFESVGNMGSRSL